MSEHIEWQRSTAIRRIEEARQQSPEPPLARLISEVAGYVGASTADVERWWNGRGR